MLRSPIKKKKCKCSEDCHKYPTMGYAGYFAGHAPEELKEKVGTKRQVAIKNRNRKNALSRDLHKVQNAVGSDELKRWFEDCRKEMTGVCQNCGKPSSRDSDGFFKFSIAHILQKAYFPSVKTHPYNWIELCFWGENSCHHNLDHGSLDLIELACFDQVITKFVAMYPSIAEKEKRRIPSGLLQYLETEK